MLNRPSPPSSSSASSRHQPQNHNSEDDILSALNNVTLSSAIPNTSVGSLTGESLSLSAGGNAYSVSKSITSKQVKVVCISNEMISSRCFGIIGARKGGFCLKPKALCTSHNNGGSHSSSKFNPNSSNYYIYRSSAGDSAWCDYTVNKYTANNFPNVQIHESESHSLDDWKTIFSSIDSDLSVTEVNETIEFMKKPTSYESLKTPSKFKKLERDIVKDETDYILTDGKKESDVALLFLTGKEKQEFKDSNIPEDLISFISDIGEVVRTMFSDMQSFRTDLVKRAMLTDVSSDILKVTSAVTGLKSSIGPNLEASYPDLWTAIDDIKDLLNTSKINFDVLKHSHENGNVELSTLEEIVTSYGKRWDALSKNWLPLLTEHEKMITKLKESSNNPTNVFSTVSATDAMLTSGPHSVPIAEVSSRNINSTLLEQKDLIDNLVARIADLESKVSNASPSEFLPVGDLPRMSGESDGYGSSGVSYKQYFFSDEESVKRWMKEHMSTPSHGLFVDLVSFSEFFGGDIYVERNKTLNDLYMSNKIGYATMADSIVAASFQNILPGSYGRNTSSIRSITDTDLQAQPELPGLPTFKKWDNHDGATGRKYWIKKECRNTGIQIDGMIRGTVFSQGTPYRFHGYVGRIVYVH